ILASQRDEDHMEKPPMNPRLLGCGSLIALASLVCCSQAHASAPKLPEVDSLEVTAVVDNFYDCFQKDEKCATRVTFGKGNGFEDIRLQGEMSLGYVITASVGGKKHVILFDFGMTPSVYQNNLTHLKIDVSKAEALVLSHGHEDHYGGM